MADVEPPLNERSYLHRSLWTESESLYEFGFARGIFPEVIDAKFVGLRSESLFGKQTANSAELHQQRPLASTVEPTNVSGPNRHVPFTARVVGDRIKLCAETRR